MKLHLPPRLIRVLIALVSGFPIIASIADASMSESVTNDLFISVGGNTTNSSISGYDNVVADGIVDGDFILSSSWYGDPVIIDRNGKVLFAGNLASCIRLVSTNLEIADNGEVVFEDNNAGLNGVIHMYHNAFDVSIIDNKLVRFSRNEGQSSTICYADEIIATSNDELIFEDNSCVSPGGCLFACNLVELSNNDNINFLRNSTDSKGGAIALVDRWTGELYGEFMGRTRSLMKDNGAISFVENTAKDDGGAICASLIEIMDNSGLVLFSDNSAACGGAMNGCEVTISGNSTGVDFSGNIAEDSGGAIYMEPAGNKVIVSNNGAVRFSENSAAAYGGAICMREWGSRITMCDNSSLTFIGNSASHGGGAISVRVDYNSIRISGNGSVTFSNNCVSSPSSSGGGAIEGLYIELVDNGSVIFSGNGSSGVDAAYGGAIWCMGGLDICNNDSVEFYQNYVNTGGTYRLQSINGSYSYGDVVFSAAAGKKITFRDSIFIDGGTLNLNANFIKSDTNIFEQKGDIIFTGKSTEDDLYIVKGNVAGTSEEILASRTTEVNTMTNLYGGRLCVEDRAIYKGYGITAHAGSDSTVLVKDAVLSHEGNELHFFEGTTLEALGESEIFGEVIVESTATAAFSALTRLEGSLTLFSGSELCLAGELTLDGALRLGTGLTLSGDMLEMVNQLQAGQSLTLMVGLDSMAVQSSGLLKSATYTDVVSGQILQASHYFSNLGADSGLVLVYDEVVGSLSMSKGLAIPEPATATLSLLSLAGLVVRRRRK